MPREKQSSKDEPTSSPTCSSRPKCCLCRKPVLITGYCEHCLTWPINVTPNRTCACGNRADVSGWCMACNHFTLTELEPHPGEWIDTGRIPRRLTREEAQRLAREVSATLSGPGWPEKIVPLQRRYIPRSWKRRTLRVVGQTVLGYDVVIPESVEAAPDPTDTVPF